MIISIKKSVALIFCMIGVLILVSWWCFMPFLSSYIYLTTQKEADCFTIIYLFHYIGSFFIYYFGGVGTVILGVLLFKMAYLLLISSIKDILSYVIASITFMVSAASYVRWYDVDTVPRSLSGGYLGVWVLGIIQIAGYSCGLLMMHALLVASFLVVIELYGISLLLPVTRSMRYLIILLMTKETMMRIICASKKILQAIGRILYFLLVWAKKILKGEWIHPEEVIVAIDYDLHRMHLIEVYHDLVSQDSNDSYQLLAPVVDHAQETVHKAGSLRPLKTAQPNNVKNFILPNHKLFNIASKQGVSEEIKKELKAQADLLEQKLERFNVFGSVVGIESGPVVTIFEYQPQIDTKLSKIVALEDDLAMALEALSIRIIAPIPGRSVVGFEIANKKRLDVLFSAVMHSPEYMKCDMSLPLVLGRDTVGKEVIVDLARMPHLLLAGSTGSGKSVGLNGMLVSLLCKRSPEELKLILIDPKRLEFMTYADIPHLLVPVVVEPQKAIMVLKWVVNEMEERYVLMAEKGARSIFDFNKHAESKMPFIVIVIDELSDLMLTVGREVEEMITRITQMARAAGIHMIVATQRPSVDVITGLIKVNFPCRISFRVTSKVDSRTILDVNGAEKLLGKGDMLFLDALHAQLRRIHGAYITTAEIEKVVEHVRAQASPEYIDVSQIVTQQDQSVDADDRALYESIVEFVMQQEDTSISLLQREFKIGYNRAARMMSLLEAKGLILPADGSKKRKIIK